MRIPLLLVEAAGVLGAGVCAFAGVDGVFPTRGDATGGSGVFMLLLGLGAEPGVTP